MLIQFQNHFNHCLGFNKELIIIFLSLFVIFIARKYIGRDNVFIQSDQKYRPVLETIQYPVINYSDRKLDYYSFIHADYILKPRYQPTLGSSYFHMEKISKDKMLYLIWIHKSELEIYRDYEKSIDRYILKTCGISLGLFKFSIIPQNITKNELGYLSITDIINNMHILKAVELYRKYNEIKGNLDGRISKI